MRSCSAAHGVSSVLASLPTRLPAVLSVALLTLLLTACGGAPSSTLRLDSSGGSDAPENARVPWKAVAAGRQPLRVGLAVGVSEVQLSAEQSFEVRDGARRFLARVRGPATMVVRARSGADPGFTLREISRGSWSVDAAELRLKSESGQTWRVGEDDFTGSLRIVRGAGGVTLIEEVGMERYLEGVVPWEIGRPDAAAFAAVQAQAIAARTYAYAHLGHWEELGFDLRADVGDQVYRGRTGTSEITDRGVRSTRGRVLVHDGRLLRAYYSSTCGGYSADLVDVWQKEGAPYLRGGPDRWRGRTACSTSGQFRWTETWSARELGDIVRRCLPAELGRDLDDEDIGILRGLRVVDRDRSGRVQRLEIETDRDRFELWGDRIRWVLRPARGRFGILRSTLFDVEEVHRDGVLIGVRVLGGGFGHGVGLCQTGALQRARWGQSAREILEHYYQGARVIDVGSLDAIAVARR